MTAHVTPSLQKTLDLILSCTVATRSLQLSFKYHHFLLTENQQCPQNSGTWFQLHTFTLGTLVHILEFYSFVFWGIYCNFHMITTYLLH